MDSVTVRVETRTYPTYVPEAPDRNPMYLDRRVYQGSSGKVYPLPFYNRIAETPVPKDWLAITIENEHLQVLILPELGGRIHAARDKASGYELIYHQPVIKPALVGLAGPWVSGGIEFNWPQHHRPATYMPVEWRIEEAADGSKTVWLSDHDPLERLKGMHGVCLRPGVARIDLKARVYNRTPLVQTFLWWANVGVHAHERYQSFFPPDVRFVADHARRAMSRFPACDGRYYGVDYGARRPPANDLTWYANIPVPTSFMCLGSKGDFSGGYDHQQGMGLVQVANHHIAPGKKQWTWGNHPFGYAWDRNLTDGGGPYIELMLGVYTDNQPDFSFLQPGETKAWTVGWYPLRRIGPAQAANARAAISVQSASSGLRVGVCVSENLPDARIVVWHDNLTLLDRAAPLSPSEAFVWESPAHAGIRPRVDVLDGKGQPILSYVPESAPEQETKMPPPATEPPAPEQVASGDELFLIGEHLWQYRHATRSPESYWSEALRRDPGDSRCNNGLGLLRLRRGEWAEAEAHFRTAVARLTSRNPNPYDGEPYYHLGLVLRHQGRDRDAYDAYYKASWNQAWRAAAYRSLAEIACAEKDWARARNFLEDSLRLDADNLNARNLLVLVLRQLGLTADAGRLLEENLALDPLDVWGRALAGHSVDWTGALRIDLSIEYRRSGFWREAADILRFPSAPTDGTAPLCLYHRAYCLARLHDAEAAACHAAAAAAPTAYCFPSRLEDLKVLEAALRTNPRDARAAYYLANLLYHRGRREEAIALWERSVEAEPSNAVAWRNLGIAYCNVGHDLARAMDAYARARAADPGDPRLLYEEDQLWKRGNRPPAGRLANLQAAKALVARRDDATLELCALLNQTDRPSEALGVLTSRRFQPWEGGEGQAIAQYARASLALGRRALESGRTEDATALISAALNPPEILGEARHLLANCSDIYLARGDARAAAVDPDGAAQAWEQAASVRGDFQEMSVRVYSEMTYFSAEALKRLGRTEQARELFENLMSYAEELAVKPAKIDYFATSLPTMLLFDDDLGFRQATTARFLRAQALAGLGRTEEARSALTDVLARDSSHGLAHDLQAALAGRK